MKWGSEVWEWCTGPGQRVKEKECLVGNCTGAMSPYLAESLVRQTRLNHIRTSAISAQRRRQSNRNSSDRDQTSHRLRGMSASFTCNLSIIGSIQPNDMYKNFPMLRQIIMSCFLSLELSEMSCFRAPKMLVFTCTGERSCCTSISYDKQQVLIRKCQLFNRFCIPGSDGVFFSLLGNKKSNLTYKFRQNVQPRLFDNMSSLQIRFSPHEPLLHMMGDRSL